MNHTRLCFPSRSCSSFTDHGGMEGWVGLGTTMVSKQSAQDRYITEITIISCSDRHASPGNWKRSRLWESNSRLLGPKAATLTTEPPSHLKAYDLRFRLRFVSLMTDTWRVKRCIIIRAQRHWRTKNLPEIIVLLSKIWKINVHNNVHKLEVHSLDNDPSLTAIYEWLMLPMLFILPSVTLAQLLHALVDVSSDCCKLRAFFLKIRASRHRGLCNNLFGASPA